MNTNPVIQSSTNPSPHPSNPSLHQSNNPADLDSLLTDICVAWSGVSALPAEVRSLHDCAHNLATTFILHCERSDKLDALSSVPAQRDALRAVARDTLNLTTRNAL